MKYYALDDLIDLIDEPNRGHVRQAYSENYDLFSHAKGSNSKHQAWAGGYIDHVVEVGNLAVQSYGLFTGLRQLPFSLSEAVLITVLHDIEKPFKQQGLYGLEHAGVKDRRRIWDFKLEFLEKHNITLNPVQLNALRYVEGENEDYDPHRRVMNELAIFCHVCDYLSARLWYDRPLAHDEVWGGRSLT